MSANQRPIHWQKNTISVSGQISPADLRYFARALNVVIEKQGYQDIYLDFTSCSATFESFMLPVVALCVGCQSKGIDIELVLPSDPFLASLFHNTNWAYYIDPRRYQESNYEGAHHVPAIRYTNPTEQHRAVDRVVDAVLSSISGIDRSGLKALEWSLNEITDNVLNHAQTEHGGFVQASTYSESKQVEFVVADAGIGIPRSLGINSHRRALEEAIKEGVTRDSSTNAGNGLYGSYSVATISGGRFQIHSGYASLIANAGENLRILTNRPLLYPGTVVVARIDCGKESLLEQALRFGDVPHDPPFDYIERKFEKETVGEMTFLLREDIVSVGSREAGRVAKKKITNLLSMNPGARLQIDFSGIPIISSSFADEVFGRLFIELGPIGFAKLIDFKNVDRTVQSLIDRAIKQRMQSDEGRQSTTEKQ